MSKTPTEFNLAGRRMAVDLPNFIFASVIAGWIAWYCWDAWHASSAVENLILILPVSLIAMVLYLFAASGCFHTAEAGGQPTGSPAKQITRGTAIRIAGSMALLIGFVVLAPTIGFDVACFAYILLMMAFLGERRILVLFLVPLVFCLTVIYCFGTLLSTPLPVLVLRGFNR